MTIDYIERVFINGPDEQTVDEINDMYFEVCGVQRASDCPTSALTTAPEEPSQCSSSTMMNIMSVMAILIIATVAYFF